MNSIQPSDGAASSSSVLVDGRRVGVSRFGVAGGWPLVWCHGGLSCRLDAEVVDAAARQHGADVIAIDRPGIGRSDFWHMTSVAEWPHIVEQLADQLNVGEFAVTGWSGGGPCALAVAAAMPQRVRAVSTIAGGAPLEGVRHVRELGGWIDILLIASAHWSPRLAAAQLRLAKRIPERLVIAELRRGAGTRDRSVLEPALPILLSAAREATSRGVSGMVDENRRYYGSWGFDLSDIRQPVTVWQGAQDRWVPMVHARRLAAALPHGELRVVPSAGHLFPLVIGNEIVEDLAP